MGFLFTGEALEIAAAIVSSLATALGGAAASGLLDKIWQILKKSQARKIAREDPPSPSSNDFLNLQSSTLLNKTFLRPKFNTARDQVLFRIRESEVAKNRQQRLERRDKWAANSLIFGQYVIGGVMATSFMQKKLSPDLIGLFGVLVVTASLIKQHYHPEVSSQNAAQRASQLEALIRQSEDRLVVIETTGNSELDDPALVLELLERVSAELTRITLTPVDTTLSRAQATKRGK